MRNSSVTERIQQLEGHSREVKDRLAGLVTRSEVRNTHILRAPLFLCSAPAAVRAR